MSEIPQEKPLTEQEKRRILRERRQAKMAQGKATDRLNNILNQGTSVNESSVTSVLDQKSKPDATADATAVAAAVAAAESGALAPNQHDNDPEVQDIEEITANDIPTIGGSNSQPNLDEMFNKILQQQGQHSHAGHDGENNPMAEILKMFSGMGDESGTIPSSADSPFEMNPEQMKYQHETSKYNSYQEKLWRFRFLVVRVILTLTNFLYHFVKIPSFTASNHQYVRDLSIVYPLNGFITWFFTIEVLLIATYYMVFTKLGLFHTLNQKSLIMKGISTLSMFVPKLQLYQPLVARLLGYRELLGILVGDLSLVIVLFGLLSFSR
ncbi:GET2 [Candida oxycetoniae]|uniref:Golgi to ER traffic protein 2 n=1 Tax=Candida oxycetoniae TaxID=497107 RepID=A0AAI9WWG0_9ASCO|nr:GET2 [Candida oxycetoniae]KAI3402709.2 GET2 [Candida oxycetoniae]